MNSIPYDTSLHLLVPPYRNLLGVRSLAPLPPSAGQLGPVLIWRITPELHRRLGEVATRPHGMPLIGVIPPDIGKEPSSVLLRIVAKCRPAAMLVSEDLVEPSEVVHLLKQPPDDLVERVLDFLRWRGNDLPTEGRRLLRKTFELALEVRSVSGLGRALFLSRRALGRRFAALGLPVPSHCLQFARLLQAHVRLQSTDGTLSEIARDFGYPDAFSLSNQMARLLGLRPNAARERLGWEWMVETWLAREAGGIVTVHGLGASILAASCGAPGFHESGA